jgi:arylsulfatase
VREQFTHCIDIGPTVLAAIGLPEPTTVDGIEQEPMDGTSFLPTFDDAAAPEQHTVQYFEMFGSRAIYQDGWWACTRLDKDPWDFSPETIKRFAPGVYDPSADTRSCTTCLTTSPKPGTSRPIVPRNSTL